MNTFSLRWLFVAVAGAAVAVTAILNANELWLSAAKFLLACLIGVAAICVVFRGRNAPFAVGFALFSGLAYWLEPSLDLDFFSEGAADLSSETALLRICLGVAFGCVGGVICRHLAADSAPRRIGLVMWLSIIVLFSAAAIAAGVVKSDRLVAEANAAQPTPGGYGPPYGGGSGMGGYGRPGGGAGYGRPGGGAGYGRPGGGYGRPSRP
jgi:hypothetical protein